MNTTNLRKVGGSMMFAVPPAILELLHLRVGATVALTVEGERLIVQPQTKPSYTLDELLDQCDPAASISKADREWIGVARVGREL